MLDIFGTQVKQSVRPWYYRGVSLMLAQSTVIRDHINFPQTFRVKISIAHSISFGESQGMTSLVLSIFYYCCSNIIRFPLTGVLTHCKSTIVH